MWAFEREGFWLSPREQDTLLTVMVADADPSSPITGLGGFVTEKTPDQRWYYFPRNPFVLGFCGMDMSTDWKTDFSCALKRCNFMNAWVQGIFVDLMLHNHLPVLITYPDGRFEAHRIE